MTLERYVAICLPLRHPELCSLHNTQKCILIILTVSSVPCFIILSTFFAAASSSVYTQHKRCSMEMFVSIPWQNHFKFAVYQFYFFIMSITITFSYVKIMKVAKAASGENKKSTWKGLSTVILHAFQLLLCLIQLCVFLILSDLLLILYNIYFTMQVSLCIIFYLIVSLCAFVTPVTLTAMTLERYVAICLPLRHPELCSLHNTQKCILIILTVSSVPCFIIVSTFIAAAPSSVYTQHKRCSMEMFVPLPWQNHFKFALFQFYFFIMSITITFSYVKIMKVAKAASGENKKSTWKGLKVSLCIVFYLIVCLSMFVTPVTLTAMTLERYVAICLPLRHPELCSLHNTQKCILIILTVSSVPCFIILSTFFAAASSSVYTQHKLCSMGMFVSIPWQNHFKFAVYQFYFFIMSITITFSYVKIMKVAKAASGENKKSTWKGLSTVILHAFQLLLCLIQLWLGKWDEQQRSRGRAEKSKPGEQTGTRDAEAEVIVRGGKQVGCPGNRQGRQNEDRQGR
ncbi:hypothetical protein D4764_12G0003770 [Takifugu flavidus]|uniref:G-protein coupled receptors family 1 profile domain-containing protein n=1 Tax=Takifugu flavidus TaxID=433684 RepID=A0A5C6PFA6_9TELE|nr:hypothetical protein D4764_12G0003770 [Takifugu flavidus]